MRDPALKIFSFHVQDGWGAVAGLRQMVERDWETRLALLQQRVENTLSTLQGMVVVVENLGRPYADQGAYTSSLGDFAAGTVDPRSLYALVRKKRGNGAQDPERLRGLAAGLEQWRLEARANPPECLFIEPDCGADEALEKARHHIGRHAGVLRLLHLAALEQRGKYPSDLPLSLPSMPDWSRLDGLDLALLPPCLVLRTPSHHVTENLADVVQLVSAGLPIKVVVSRAGFSGEGGELRHPEYGPLEPSLENLILSLRRVFFLQAAEPADPELEKTFAKALVAPYPTVISILAGGDEGDQTRDRAQAALRARAFPNVIYDPSRRRAQGHGLDLSHNPDPEREWPLETMEEDALPGESGAREITFADFAQGEPEFAQHFLPAPEGPAQGNLVAMAEFLRLQAPLRSGKKPFVLLHDGKNGERMMVPSPYLIALTEERWESWGALREAAGTEKSPSGQQPDGTALGTASDALPDEQLETRFRERERVAVTNAMGKLVQRLSDMTGEGMNLAGVLERVSAPIASDAGGTAPVPPPAGKEPGPGGEASIETEECTTCDECITINPAIFAYNDKQQAYIKNPRGGPYRDIVKAAEKCQAIIIHPGKPQDPKELDLEKWLQRAESFN